MENKEPLTHLMDFPFGPIHSSETPYLTINYVTSAHQINIQQLILKHPLHQNSNFVRPIEPINRLILTQFKLLQYTIHTKKK